MILYGLKFFYCNDNALAGYDSHLLSLTDAAFSANDGLPFIAIYAHITTRTGFYRFHNDPRLAYQSISITQSLLVRTMQKLGQRGSDKKNG